MKFEIYLSILADLYVVYGVPQTHFILVVKQPEDEWIAGLQVDIS